MSALRTVEIVFDAGPMVRALRDAADSVAVLTQRDERDDKGRLRWLREDGSRP